MIGEGAQHPQAGLGPVVVRVLSAASTRGFVQLGSRWFACALGRAGTRAGKREGDGATPMGRWRMRDVFYRADRVRRPRTGLPVKPITPANGWCDAPRDPNYNRPVRYPYRASAEPLYRADALYDIVVVLGYNDCPRVRGRGSAIFVHVAKPNYTPTEGCIALTRQHLLRVLERAKPGQLVQVLSGDRHHPPRLKKAPGVCTPGA
jgi:L,D-peptidoglycan transpeptidase YkuD (ErfK/YbiS/YcfS/YnhG family)